MAPSKDLPPKDDPAQKRAKRNPEQAPRPKAPKISPDKAHHRLSFGEELDEEVSLSAKTAVSFSWPALYQFLHPKGRSSGL